MASSINASTSGGGGVIVSSDATGNLNLQSGGSTVVAVTSTGMAVTGTLAATGAVTASTTLAVTGASTFTGTGKFATTIGVGNATPAASGSGITFPATQSASSDANTLDDYEEGTFTPIVLGSTAAGTGTYGNQVAQYTKIGNRVLFNLYITWSNLVGATGNLQVGGLPFTTSAVASSYVTVSVWSDNLTLPASSYLTAYPNTTSTTFSLNGNIVAGGGAVNIAIDTSAGIMLAGSYSI